MGDDTMSGLVTKAQSGFFWVQTEEGELRCQIAGRLKQTRLATDLVAVGDRVTVEPGEEGTGTIQAVAERRRVLSRARPTARPTRDFLSDREQVLVANPDQVVLVFSIRRPKPSLRKLDRFLVVCERHDLPVVICVTKLDLAPAGEAEAMFRLYEELDYPVVYTSAVSGEGLPALRERLAGRLSVLAGSSGVGKSTLLNALQPGLGLRVAEVSQATEKGMHTTRYIELIPFAGGYVADTPGIRGLALFDIEANELDAYFREMAPLVSDCQFSDCTHRHEPKCAVKAAVAAGRVSPDRYESYLRLWEEQESLDRAAYGLL